jgi:hypothetical protein
MQLTSKTGEKTMRTILKIVLVAGTLVGRGIGQEAKAESSVKRHPGEHLHYSVALADGDVGKITAVSVILRTSAPSSPSQPNAGAEFGVQCQKSPDPKVWTCDLTIPSAIRDGDYQLYHVSVGSPDFGKSYDEDFHVPLVPIQNPNTLTPPSKVTVTEHP